MKKKLFMQTTQVLSGKSVSEIQYLLAEYGASAILIEYENREPIAISFKHRTNNVEVPYRLPTKWQEIKKLLLSNRIRKSYKPANINDTAKRIAWRQTRRWVEAMLAYSETNQVEFEQVFLSYIQLAPNDHRPSETLYDRVKAAQFQLEYKENKI